MGAVHKIDITINEDDIFNGAAKILEVIRPEWDQGRISYKKLTDGITNKLVKCQLEGISEEESVLVRIYGNKTDLLIDRKAETRNIILLNKVGLAPRLYATFNNGLAYEFVPGCTLTDITVIQPEIYKLVARKMAQFHKVTITGQNNPEPVLWNKLMDFFELVPDRFSDEQKHERFVKLVPSKNKIKVEMMLLKEKLVGLDSPIVFSHNDLLLGNVIYTASNNSVTFIDFEYSFFNYQGYDIGNHFAEFCGIDNVDYSKYPNKEFQYKWLKEYLLEYKNCDNISNDEIEKLYQHVNKFVAACHLLWGLWALIQAEYSYIDFDFMEYASIRFNEYFVRKEFLFTKERR